MYLICFRFLFRRQFAGFNRLIHDLLVTGKILESAFGNGIIVVSHAEVNDLESSVQEGLAQIRSQSKDVARKALRVMALRPRENFADEPLDQELGCGISATAGIPLIGRFGIL